MWTWRHQMHRCTCPYMDVGTSDAPNKTEARWSLSCNICSASHGIWGCKRTKFCQNKTQNNLVLNWNIFYHSLPKFWLSIICDVLLMSWEELRHSTKPLSIYICATVLWRGKISQDRSPKNIFGKYQFFIWNIFWQISNSTSNKRLNR